MRPRHFLILLAAALAAMAPKCSSKDCQMLRENAERICAAGSPRACEAAQQALALCPAPEPTPTATPSPEPTPTPVPTPSPTPTPSPEPTPTPTPGPVPTPTPAPGCVAQQAATEATFTVSSPGGASPNLTFHVQPKGGYWGSTLWVDRDYPANTSGNGFTCQDQECRTLLIQIGKDAADPKKKKNQGGFTVTAESGTVVKVTYAGATITGTQVVKVGPGVPCPPSPPPTPPPGGGAPSVTWKQTEQGGPDHCPEGGPSLYSDDVAKVLKEEFGEKGGTWGWDETALCSFMAPRMAPHGYASAMYGEECAFTRDGSRSENFDLLATGGAIRRPPGAYRSTCTPATRSSAVTPGPGPAPTPSPRYPAPIVRIDIRNLSQPQPGHYVIDATALACDGGHNPDFPDGHGGLRQCWPACGPEGAHPPGCDDGLAPVWTGVCRNDETHKDPWCNGGGNPWQFRSNVAGSRARVCAQGVCSPEQEVK